MIQINDEAAEYNREHYWMQSIPIQNASNWHCKYHIRVTRRLVSSEYEDDRGYIML
jgi:hypothetical protein